MQKTFQPSGQKPMMVDKFKISSINSEIVKDKTFKIESKYLQVVLIVEKF